VGVFLQSMWIVQFEPKPQMQAFGVQAQPQTPVLFGQAIVEQWQCQTERCKRKHVQRLSKMQMVHARINERLDGPGSRQSHTKVQKKTLTI